MASRQPLPGQRLTHNSIATQCCINHLHASRSCTSIEMNNAIIIHNFTSQNGPLSMVNQHVLAQSITTVSFTAVFQGSLRNLEHLQVSIDLHLLFDGEAIPLMLECLPCQAIHKGVVLTGASREPLVCSRCPTSIYEGLELIYQLRQIFLVLTLHAAVQHVSHGPAQHPLEHHQAKVVFLCQQNEIQRVEPLDGHKLRHLHGCWTTIIRDGVILQGFQHPLYPVHGPFIVTWGQAMAKRRHHP
mmetsp:Transcript_48210/g.114643  ORF Transcript_48210/g.114643 Transcript_48210/m.114643 type:complete len:243 (-) Transcript_48210:556-1284(-)